MLKLRINEKVSKYRMNALLHLRSVTSYELMIKLVRMINDRQMSRKNTIYSSYLRPYLDIFLFPFLSLC